MAIKGRPYEKFGSYILFKKLETDALSELWRAGHIESDAIGSTLALRRFIGGDRATLTRVAEDAGRVVPQIHASTVLRDQQYGVTSGTPYIVHEYANGRTIRHIVQKAKGGAAAPHPIAIDQALAIIDKVAASVESLNGIRLEGTRLNHTSLLPQFCWITDDGEVRVGGQLFGEALIRSLASSDVAAEIGGYIAPELRISGAAPSKASDVFSLGAILHLLLTGEHPAVPQDEAALAQQLTSATLMASASPIPADIRPILMRALASDPAARFPSAADFRQAVGSLLQGGAYAPTTFNLAFYLHTLLKKELEGEAADREKESKITLAAYKDAPPTRETREQAATASAAVFAQADTSKKSRMPLAIAAGLIVVVAGGLAVKYTLGGRTAAPPPEAVQASVLPAATPPASIPAPVVVTATPAADTATAAVDLDAQKKAREEAINLRLQEEMMKLQAEYERELKKQGAREQPAAAPREPQRAAAIQPQPLPAVVTEAEPSAAQLDASRRQQQQAAAAQSPQAPAPLPAAVAERQVASVPQPAAAPVVRDGDLVELAEVDQAPRLLSKISPAYPPAAMRQRAEGTVILSVLISETGKVADVKILRGDSKKMGFEDAAVRAVRSASFSPATKSGKRVRTWMPVPVRFAM